MAKRIESLVGKRFGNLIVESLVGKDKYSNKMWKCKCDCGNYTIVRQGHLRSGHTTSCGCNKFQLNDLTNKRFGLLTVLFSLL